jgi:hypothetical protein
LALVKGSVKGLALVKGSVKAWGMVWAWALAWQHNSRRQLRYFAR